MTRRKVKQPHTPRRAATKFTRAKWLESDNCGALAQGFDVILAEYGFSEEERNGLLSLLVQTTWMFIK